MIPDKSDPRWMDLITGKKKHQFKFAAASLCVSRNMREVAKDPSLQQMMKSVDEIHALFTKYEKFAADDLRAIFG
jgi:hypothetical protein